MQVNPIDEDRGTSSAPNQPPQALTYVQEKQIAVKQDTLSNMVPALTTDDREV